MNKYRNELEAFIYEYCIEDIQREVWAYCAGNKEYRIIDEQEDEFTLIEKMLLASAECKYVDSSLKIIARLICPVLLQRDDDLRKQFKKKVDNISVEVYITINLQGSKDQKDISCKYVLDNNVGCKQPKPIQENIIPFINANKLDDEAECFLKMYYPDALEAPMPVPIKEIASKMGLTLLENYRLTEDFSVFGQICFEDMNVTVFDCENNQPQSIQVKAGTIFVDPDTFWQRNAGCVNNTIAHEIVHWHKHRWYPVLCKLLDKKLEMAHRCPAKITRPDKNAEWTNVQSMEWQANKLAPRILMPAKTFRQKVEELYGVNSYSSAENDDDKLKRIIQKLGEFYGVSKQSVILRMIEVGFEEVRRVNQETAQRAERFISSDDILKVYMNNPVLRKLIDTREFLYINGICVRNRQKYIELGETGYYRLTKYAKDNIEECTLRFKGLLSYTYDLGDTSSSVLSKRKSSTVEIEYTNDYEWTTDDKKIEEMDALVDEALKIKSIINQNEEGWDILKDLLEYRDIRTNKDFERVTGYNSTMYNNITGKRKGRPRNPDMRTILTITHLLKINYAETKRILSKSGCPLGESNEHMIIDVCCTTYQCCPLEQINKALSKYQIAPLGPKTYNKPQMGANTI